MEVKADDRIKRCVANVGGDRDNDDDDDKREMMEMLFRPGWRRWQRE